MWIWSPRWLCDRYHPTMMAFTGVAGAIDPSLSVGDLVVARRTIQHDAGVITPGGLERYQAGHVPFFNPTDAFGYEPSPGLLAAATSVIDEIELRPGTSSSRIPSLVTGSSPS
jgi:adenosylhomocysteine nucleosidase